MSHVIRECIVDFSVQETRLILGHIIGFNIRVSMSVCMDGGGIQVNIISKLKVFLIDG